MRATSFLLLAISLGTVLGPAAPASAEDHDGKAGVLLVGGEPETHEMPFVSSLQYEYQGNLFHACAATLVRPEWVVTAAHCVIAATPALVRVGSLDRTSGGSVRAVAQVVIHPATNPSALPHHDIALLRLSAPVPQRPARIAPTAHAGAAVRLLGWGMTCAANTPADPCPIPTVLHRFDTRVLPDRSPACRHDGRLILDPRTELCTANGHPGGPCFTDSGGPALRFVSGRWRLAGVTSRLVGFPCGHAPAIYTDVTAYTDWIRATTQ